MERFSIRKWWLISAQCSEGRTLQDLFDYWADTSLRLLLQKSSTPLCVGTTLNDCKVIAKVLHFRAVLILSRPFYLLTTSFHLNFNVIENFKADKSKGLALKSSKMEHQASAISLMRVRLFLLLCVFLSALTAYILQHLPTYLPVWPDLAKFCRFRKSLQVFGKFLTVYFLFGTVLNLLWQICDIIGLIFILTNGQILNNNLTIWWYCYLPIYLGR